MDRDDLILRAITDGATSSAALVACTGLTPSSVWRGLRHLVATGHVFSPTWAVYRLTASGEAVLALTAGEAPTAPDRATDPGDRPAPVTSSTSARDLTPASHPVEASAAESRPETEHHDLPADHTPAKGRSTVPSWLRWVGLGALGVGVTAFLYVVTRSPASMPPEPPAPPTSPVGWPYNGWQGWGF